MKQDWEDLLWRHQVDAVRVVRRYLDAKSTGSALVRMPTGTGKTGVMAILGKCFPDTRNILVVVPFVALRHQLVKEISELFWRKTGIDNPLKELRPFLPSNSAVMLAKPVADGCIYVCTIQTLQSLASDTKYEQQYAKLKDIVDLVMFDEGHREPANEWAKAIRGLEKPVVLFTATPYRNDHKLFMVDPDHTYRFSYHEAVEGNYIRRVKFQEEPFARTAADFVDALLNFFEGAYRKLAPKGIKPRVIVRCETREAVKEIKDAFDAKRPGQAIAIHERLQDEEDEFKAVPDPSATGATFWIHQYKLIEGIDDPRFALLAIYQPLKNGRALVQQVGRVLRTTQRLQQQEAYVFCHPEDRQQHFWDNYLQYEQLFQSDERQFHHRDMFDSVTRLQTPYHYFEGNFRKRFDIDAADAYVQLSYPLSTTIFWLDDDFSLQSFAAEVNSEWAKLDRDVRNWKCTEPGVYVHLYTAYLNSPILRDHFFLEFQLGFTVYIQRGSLLFYYDSHGVTPEYLKEKSVRVSPAKLQALLEPSTRISNVSLINSDIGKHSVRRRTMNAYSILETAPSLQDYAHFCSTATGALPTGGRRWLRRYVGFSRARVRDIAGQGPTYSDYLKWVDTLARELEASNQGTHPLFRRFAPHSDPPDLKEATNILLDVENVRRLVAATGKEAPLQITELCLDVKDGAFRVVTPTTEYDATVEWDKKKRQYTIESKLLEREILVTDHNNRPENLVTYLNRNQAFRMVLEDPKYIYAHGHFYAPGLALDGDLQLSSLFRQVDRLATTTNEKGARGTATGKTWANNSLFGLIDALGHGTELARDTQGIDLLVCDDLATETADFIAVNSSGKEVVFIHAKALDGAKSSATAFHEVCSQAVKNLSLLSPYSSPPRANISRWAGDWEQNPIGRVFGRIRLGPRDPRLIWDKVRTLVRDPSASRQVWIIMGAGFSLSHFDAQRLKSTPPPQITQIVYLLTSTWSAVSSVGATLRIYCSP